MAKLTAIQALNEVLKRIGEPVVTALTSLSVIQQQGFDNLNRALEEIAQDTDNRPLEAEGTVTLLTSTSTYATSAITNYRKLAYESVHQTNDKNSIRLITSDEFDLMFPEGITTDRQGYPNLMTEKLGKFHFDKVPTANENSKVVTFRYQQIPTLYETATEAGTSFMPEGFDRTLLCDYATWITMQYMGHPEIQDYYFKVFGSPDNNSPEGHLSKFKRTYQQPFFKPRVTYHF